MKSIISHLKIKWLAGSLCIITILMTLAVWNIPDTRLHVDFLDIGQGDAILVWQGDQQILIDGGPSAKAIELQLGKHLPFWDRTLELVVLTHPDADHLTGLVDILNKYRVEKVLCAEFESVSQIFENWNTILEEKQIETIVAETGQEFDLGNGILLEVLNPSNPDLFEAGSDDNGVVVRLNDGKVSFLFTGDIGARGEFALISEQANLRSTILKVAHHGSSGSTTNDFLDAVNPQIAVISVGRDNRYNHPGGDTLDRLRDQVGEANIYRTDQSGTIGFITDGNSLWMMNKS